jgi:hypothetical protein
MHKQISQLMYFAVALAFTIPATAQEDDKVSKDMDDGMTSCITLRNVRRTEVIDDRNVLYHMRGKTVYLNVLPRACNGLARENRFSYATTMGRLCDLDSITVLYPDPSGLRGGNSCQLGKFHNLTREDARALKENPNPEPESNPLPMPPPQEVGVEDDAKEPEAG